MDLPPLMSNTAAVEKEFSSEDNQQTIEESSLISKKRPLGTFESIHWTCSFDIWSKILVFAPAGVIAFTAMLYYANSFPNDLVRPITPALAELYALAFAFPSLPATEAIFTIRP